MDPALDNPIYRALASDHARFALGAAGALRYPADIAPFLAVATPDDDPGPLVSPGESLHCIGVLPTPRPGFTIAEPASLLQMVAATRCDAGEPPSGFRRLGPADVPAMLALTAAVFPGYFRARTPLLGTYVGIFRDGELVAMAGERLRVGPHAEISGVCTATAYLGQGFARALVAWLVDMQLAAGLSPFLHVGPGNVGAVRIYEKLGFTVRAEVPICQVRR